MIQQDRNEVIEEVGMEISRNWGNIWSTTPSKQLDAILHLIQRLKIVTVEDGVPLTMGEISEPHPYVRTKKEKLNEG